MQRFLTGIDKHLASSATVSVAGKSYTQAQLRAVVQGLLDKAEAVRKAQAVLVDAWPEFRTLEKSSVPFVVGFRHAMRNQFGASYDVLTVFGIGPPPKVKLTLETKVAAVEKRKATRAARHTKGKAQRAKIKRSAA